VKINICGVNGCFLLLSENLIGTFETFFSTTTTTTKKKRLNKNRTHGTYTKVAYV